MTTPTTLVTNSGVTFSDISTTLGVLSTKADEKMKAIMTELSNGVDANDKELSTAQIAVMQQKMQDWTYTRELEAKANEKLGDLMKSIVAKS